MAIIAVKNRQNGNSCLKGGFYLFYPSLGAPLTCSRVEPTTLRLEGEDAYQLSNPLSPLKGGSFEGFNISLTSMEGLLRGI